MDPFLGYFQGSGSLVGCSVDVVKYQPGKPVGYNSRLLSINYGLLWGIVACSWLDAQWTADGRTPA